jgi:uncharacterized protein (TIGR02996 family)
MARKKPAGQDGAFLDAIAEAPEDDAPRLIYADWLEDNAQPHRAEFIRAQCRLARMEEYDPDRLPLEQREAELLCVCEEQWKPPLPTWARGGYRHAFVRGFYDRLSVTATDMLKRGRGLFAVVPVSDLQIRNLLDKMPQVAACPLLGRLTALDFHENRLSPEAVRTLGASPHLGALRSITLTWTQMTAAHAQALAGWPTMPRMRHLELTTRADEMLEALAGPGGLTSLERLRLRGPAKSAGLRALADAAPALTHLELSGESLTRDGLAALARPGRLPALSSLTVTRRGRADALADAAVIERLSALEVNAPMMSGVLEELARGSGLARLRRLTLDGPDLSAHEAGLLASAPLDALTHLHLDADLDAEAVGLLAASPRLAGLRWLDLSSNPMGDEGAAALAASPHLRGLAYLDLGYCEIGPRGAAALAASPNLARLRYLSLTRNELGDDGVRALAASPHLGELRVLELVGVEAGEEGLRSLARSRGMGNLRRLEIYYNEFESADAVAREFADPSRLANLLSLVVEPFRTGASTLTELGRAVSL